MTVEPTARIDPVHSRHLMGRFASGVAVSAATTAGLTRGMTASAFISGSLAPPRRVVSPIAAETATSHDCGDRALLCGHILTPAIDDRPPLLFHAGRFAALVPLREPVPTLPEFW